MILSDSSPCAMLSNGPNGFIMCERSLLYLGVTRTQAAEDQCRLPALRR